MNRSHLIEHLWLKASVESPWWPRLVDRDPQRAVETYWRYKMRSPLDLQHPVTLNEKIQWLKLYGDQATWSACADKLQVKQLLEDKGLGRYLTQTYGVWDRAKDIDFDSLPDRFVLKCTHDCGSTIVVHDKNRLDRRHIVRQLDKRLRNPYGYHSTELHYIDIPRRVIAEELIDPAGDPTQQQSLTDYKFWCFNGHAELCFICFNRGEGSHQHHVMKDIYTAQEFQPFREGLVPAERPSTPFLKCPPHYDEMLSLAETLSKGHPEVRVDLYNVNGKIYFGELTFTSFGGIMRYFTPEMQRRMGDLTVLPAQN